MKKIVVLLMALVVAAGLVAFAGEGAKCTAKTQECLDYMAKKLKDRGWVGLELERNAETGALKVRRVVDESPAERAGFKSGDQLVGLNGVRYDGASEEDMKKAYETMVPGKTVVYLIRRGDREQALEVTLADMPQEVLARIVGQHMLEHATVAQAQK